MDCKQRVHYIGEKGEGAGKVKFPRSICESPSGALIVSDSLNNTIQKFYWQPHELCYQARIFFSPEYQGEFTGIAPCGVGEWYVVVDQQNNSVLCVDYTGFCKWETAKDTFRKPQGVAILPDGRIVLAESMAGRLRVLDSNTGEVVGDICRGDGVAWRRPTHVAVDAMGLLYVVDFDPSPESTSSIVVITVDGTVMRIILAETLGVANYSLFLPCGVAIDAVGNVLVPDYHQRCVFVLHPDGTATHLVTHFAVACVLVTRNNRIFVSGYGYLAEISL